MNGTFIGYDTHDKYVSIKDETTNMDYYKYGFNNDAMQLRNTSHVKSKSTTFTPVVRPWYIGAYENYVAYKKSHLLADKTKHIKVNVFVCII